MTVDLSNATLHEFVLFLFNRPVVPVPERPGDGPEPWYWNTETTFNPEHIAGLYIQLFSRGTALLGSYSDAQLEQGFWAIHGCNLDCSAGNIIWEPSVPLEKRSELVQSMRYIFKGLLAERTLDTAIDMWWDSLAYDWHCGNRARANGGEDAQMQDVMFETLCSILDSPAGHIQYAALHGLGHLHHPNTDLAVKTWLASRPSTDPDLVSYAEAAARFEVM